MAKSLAQLTPKEGLDLGRFLPLAVAVVERLHEVHRAKGACFALQTANVVVDGDAVTLPTPREPDVDANGASLDALAYIAPEQTGRLDCRADHRSDLYALGAIFYEMLTGAPPFVESDSMGYVHAHLARLPVSVDRVRPTVPRAVAAIVDRLLAKTPEERYSSALGLRADLCECLDQWTAKGDVAPFVPGARDAAARLSLPQKLYGRERDVAELLAAFERVSRGPRELFLIAGAPGVGKSALAHEVQRPIVRRGGYFLSGKFDQYRRNVPYASLLQALRELVRRVLSEPEDRVAAWRDDLLGALGPNGQLLIDVIPELELLVGAQPPVQELGPAEAQSRFDRLFKRFIRVLSRPDRPLALFLDDLQWADTASLLMLERLMSEKDGGHLLFIGSYRDDEVDEGHPLSVTLRAIEVGGGIVTRRTLGPIDEPAVTALVADTLSSDAKHVAPLARVLHETAGGNPFFLGQLLLALQQRGLLAIDPEHGRWQWDLERVRREPATTDLEQLMRARFARLTPAAQRALELASCLGASFDLATLALVARESTATTEGWLREATAEGLMVATADGWAFAHDDVQQIAWSRMDPTRRGETNLAIGRLLREALAPAEIEERVFDVVGPLNAAAPWIDDPKERLAVARLDLTAGRRALSASAYGPASAYFEAGLALLGDDGWELDHALTIGLHLEAAESLLLADGPAAEAKAERLLGTALGRARSAVERADLELVRVAHYTQSGRFVDAVRAGLRALGPLDVALSPREEDWKGALEPSLARVAEKMKGRKASDLAAAPRCNDPAVIAAMRVLMTISQPAYNSSQELFPLVVLAMVDLSLSRGHTAYSAYGYVTYAIFLGAFGDHKAAHAQGQLALALSDAFGHVAVTPKVNHLFATFVDYWVNPLRGGLPYLRRARATGLDAGDFIYAGLASIVIVMHRLAAGDPLPDVLADLDQLLLIATRAKDENTQSSLRVARQVILNLQGLTLDRASLDAGDFTERAFLEHARGKKLPFAESWFHALRLQVLALRRSPAAMDAARDAEAQAAASFGLYSVTEMTFYGALAAATAGDRTKLAAYAETLAAWAKVNPASFDHKHLLVLAEAARLDGRDAEARDLYDRATQAARSGGAPHHEGLVNELAGRFHAARGRLALAGVHLAGARAAALAWGATGLAADLANEFGPLLPESVLPPIPVEPARLPSAKPLDLGSIMAAQHAISEELVLDRLLRRLMTIILQNAGAETGCLILEKRGALVVEVEGALGKPAPVLLQSIPIEAAPLVCAPIVKYVARTLETVLLEDAARRGPFVDDPRIESRGTKSVLCTPLLTQGRLVGVLYLENNLAAGAFTPDRLEVVTVLSTQAATSLKNALLYETMEQLVDDRTEQLRKKNDELLQTLDRIKAMQNQIIMHEKLASLGALTAGIAHEIKNPLNFVNNFADLSVELVAELRTELDELVDAAARERLAPLFDDLAGNVAKIREHGKRADRIVHGMLVHARGPIGTRQRVGLNPLVKDSVNLAYHGMRARHAGVELRLDLDLDPSVGDVDVVPEDLSRVVLNLANNGFYAALDRRAERASGGGPASVRVATRRLGDERVEIRVRDNGPGISREIFDKIFAPFFTTKPAGEGTGLGLSISHEIIVRGHGGSIDIETEEGRFTEFVVAIPRGS